MLAFHKSTGKIQWQVLDLLRLSWHSIPAMPCKDKVCPLGFRCVLVLVEGTLYVWGGVVSDVDRPLNLVLKYKVLENSCSGLINGKIYVSGGNNKDL